MRLRPELVLLQKTMATVEGVARRIYPEPNIWQAADPVVRRWILRELSPPARIKRFGEAAGAALRNNSRLIGPAPAAASAVACPELGPEPGHRGLPGKTVVVGT